MQADPIINNIYFEDHYIQKLRDSFNTNTPIRHVVIDNFLSDEFASEIARHFPSLQNMKKHYHGLNEQKAEDSAFEHLHPVFMKLHQALSSEDFKSWVESWTGIMPLFTINDRLGYGLHQGGNNSFLDIHIDYNIHPVQKMHRKINLILFFNPEWEQNWGGQLELWDSDVRSCIQSINPSFNRCVFFECSEISYHGYSRIGVPEGITRKSFYQYFFTKVSPGLTYHDTIFKTRPKENTIKKIITPLKEITKNTAKKILFYTGLHKYLK